MWWVSVAGLSVLLLLWLNGLLKMLKGDPKPEAFVIPGPPTPADPLPDPAPSLSIVIPARDEIRNIEACVTAALAVQWPGALQVVVIDDRSTDGTGEVLARLAAEDDRLTVLMGADPPEGWLGKPHALHRAQQSATGDWLLFIDADVIMHPEGPARLIGRAISQGAVMLSGLGHLKVDGFWERVVQTRMGALIAGGNPLEHVNDPEHEQAMANGQCLGFTREAYDEMGGHEAIRGSVLDDVDFARLAKSEKVPYRLFFAQQAFSCHMYVGLKEIWAGWTKNLFPALEYKWSTTLLVVFFIALACLLPFGLLAKNLALVASGQPFEPIFLGLEAATCGCILLVDALGHRLHGYKWGLFWTFPLGIAVVLAIFLNSAIQISTGRGTVWKGRRVEARR